MIGVVIVAIVFVCVLSFMYGYSLGLNDQQTIENWGIGFDQGFAAGKEFAKGSEGEETEEQPGTPEESENGTVRCKDCIYYQWENELPGITEFMECTRPDPEDPEWHLKYHFKSDNDTCPHGVRKKKESEASQ